MKLNRVVVTGYGVTSPIGNTPEEFWDSLKEGKFGIGPITNFDPSVIGVHNAAEIKDFPLEKHFVKKDKNRMDMYSIYAIHAALEALENAHLDTETVDHDRFGVIVSSGIGGLKELKEEPIVSNRSSFLKHFQIWEPEISLFVWELMGCVNLLQLLVRLLMMLLERHSVKLNLVFKMLF